MGWLQRSPQFRSLHRIFRSRRSRNNNRLEWQSGSQRFRQCAMWTSRLDLKRATISAIVQCATSPFRAIWWFGRFVLRHARDTRSSNRADQYPWSNQRACPSGQGQIPPAQGSRNRSVDWYHCGCTIGISRSDQSASSSAVYDSCCNRSWGTPAACQNSEPLKTHPS